MPNQVAKRIAQSNAVAVPVRCQPAQHDILGQRKWQGKTVIIRAKMKIQQTRVINIALIVETM